MERTLRKKPTGLLRLFLDWREFWGFHLIFVLLGCIAYYVISTSVITGSIRAQAIQYYEQCESLGSRLEGKERVYLFDCGAGFVEETTYDACDFVRVHGDKVESNSRFLRFQLCSSL